MASIKATAAGYEAELEIPDDEQVMHSLRYQLMLELVTVNFQAMALDPGGESKLTAIAALRSTASGAVQSAISAAMAADLPEVTITPA